MSIVSLSLGQLDLWVVTRLPCPLVGWSLKFIGWPLCGQSVHWSVWPSMCWVLRLVISPFFGPSAPVPRLICTDFFWFSAVHWYLSVGLLVGWLVHWSVWSLVCSVLVFQLVCDSAGRSLSFLSVVQLVSPWVCRLVSHLVGPLVVQSLGWFVGPLTHGLEDHFVLRLILD